MALASLLEIQPYTEAQWAQPHKGCQQSLPGPMQHGHSDCSVSEFERASSIHLLSSDLHCEIGEVG